jgi:hypothetical protein
VSLNLEAGRARFGGSCGSDDEGESMVVANARVQGVRDLDRVRTVDVANRHRDRGIDAAMVNLVSVEGTSDDEERNVLRLSDNAQPWIPESRHRTLRQARCQTAQTQRGRSSPHSRHPCTPLIRPIFNVHQFTAPASTTPLTLHTGPPPPNTTNCSATPWRFPTSIRQRPRLAERERDTF